MSESYDYQPAPQWKAHDFGAARKAYDAHIGSSYSDATAKGVTAGSLIEPKVRSTAERPLIIVIDQTGSMGEWPKTMFSKLPYLDHEVRDYLGSDAEICFVAIGDAWNRRERYPLQVRPFTTGADLAKRLTELVIVGDGGGNQGESYELAALYLARNLEVSPMAQPIVIFIGDEPYHDPISIEDAKAYSQVTLQKRMPAREAFAELQAHASVYFIQKPYGSSSFSEQHGMNGATKEANDCWVSVMGDDHVALLADPNRVVDVIFGILAREVNRVDDFKHEIEGRQKPGQVAQVYKSLATIHAVGTADRKALKSGNSVLLGSDSGEASKPLGG
jgi:hypothetical protein